MEASRREYVGSVPQKCALTRKREECTFQVCEQGKGQMLASYWVEWGVGGWQFCFEPSLRYKAVIISVFVCLLLRTNVSCIIVSTWSNTSFNPVNL